MARAAAASGSESTNVSVDGHRIKLTNLDKVMYPETGTTKAEVLDYYARIADVLIPHAAHRPLTRKRYVHGVGTDEHPGQMFFQKNLEDSAPGWIAHRAIQHSDHVNDYPLLNDRATLVWFAQLAALELHVPQWRFGRTGARTNPDRIVFDLDPGEGAGLAECVEVAGWVRAILTDMGLDAMPVTSGSKGIHLYAALDGTQDADQVSTVAHELARLLEADHPDLVVSDMKKALRGGKVLVDWSQNNGNKTTIAPYSLRGRPHPMVAAPRTWDELASPGLAQLDFREVLERVERDGDPLAALTAGHLASLEPTEAHLDSFPPTDAARDRLAKYRSMRDAAKTPEPVPEAASGASADASSGMSFVIQEHHARALHWDFRLEHDGVLVSWALPKGVPTDPKQNHLAVQTEDHPLEYGTFEGSIPSGEYGGGEVEIWDSGTYELEKWREGKEVICTIHGEKHGSHEYALIHTGGRGGQAANNWLIHLMESEDDAPDAPQKPGRVKRARTTVGSPRATARKAIEPMLATLGSESDLDTGDAWAFEMKWDGIRAIATVADGVVTLVSRNGNDLTATYPDLSDVPSAVDGDAVLDGEIVALDARGRPDFGRLQQRMNLTKASEIAAAAASVPVQYFVFDVLESAGTGRMKEAYDARRELLGDLVHDEGAVRVPPAFDGDAAAAMSASRELGLEGVMAKKRDSTYTTGRRTSAWIKLKHHLAQEVVIGGWRPGKGRRANQVGSLLMGIPDGDRLTYVGRVGTGFRDRDLVELTARFRSLERKTTPFADVPRAEASDAHWVTPRIVGEVEFAEWTATGRLRQPSWRGLRPDKDADQVVRESP